MNNPRKEKNAVEALLEEIDRVTALVPIYQSIGPTGLFAVTMMNAEIIRAKQAIGSGDVIEIVRSLEELRGFDE